MAANRTFTMIKPDAVESNHIGEIISQFEKENLHVAAIKMIKMTPDQAKEFYAEHKERPFYNDLVTFVTSGPVVLMVLQGDNAIAKNRDLMGATKNPAEGSLRHKFGKSITKNAVHGSDSVDSAKREISFFFQPSEIVNLK